METETRDLQPTPEQMATWRAYKAQQAQQLVCTRCGRDNAVTECPDWCRAIESGCDCRHPHCGVCMRTMGTTTASMGHP